MRWAVNAVSTLPTRPAQRSAKRRLAQRRATGNSNYRSTANGPFYDKIEWKGGGDAVSAARAVLQAGDYNIAWNLQIEQAVLNQLTGSGAKGKVGFQNGFGVERIYLNLTDPNKEVDGERSSIKAPHPFFADKAVRRAFATAIDRKTIASVVHD